MLIRQKFTVTSIRDSEFNGTPIKMIKGQMSISELNQKNSGELFTDFSTPKEAVIWLPDPVGDVYEIGKTYHKDITEVEE